MTVALAQLRRSVVAGRPVERACFRIGAALIAVGLVHLLVQGVLGGPWTGPVSWRKPVTFGLSFGVTLISVTWVASFLRLGDRARRWTLGAVAAASVALIVVQAWRGVPSHFNLATTLDAAIARVLAAGGGVLIVVLTTLFVLSLRPQPQLLTTMARAVRVGFATLVGALAVGATMIVIGVTQVVAGDPQAAYATGGSLKPAHFAAMHGIAILPGLAWLTSYTSWTDRRRARVVALGTAGYLTAVGAVVVALAAGATPLAVPAWATAIAGTTALLAAGAHTLVALVRDGARTHATEDDVPLHHQGVTP